MNDAVFSALITGGLALIGVVVTSVVTSRKNQREIEHKLETHQAVTDTKLDELTREVRLHNGFAEKIPVMQEQIKELKGSVEVLKNYHME
ncbi:MAG: hypothetical protein J6J78_02790 [Clostridia bacterium]|nr:hypothetical protein [Clostridia bacterium]